MIVADITRRVRVVFFPRGVVDVLPPRVALSGMKFLEVGTQLHNRTTSWSKGAIA